MTQARGDLDFRCSHRYDSGFVLEAEFRAGPGVTALVGPSGSGKTTILKLIAGLLAPASGRIAVGEHRLVDTSGGICLPPEQRMIGFVFQDYRLFPHLTVEGNLLYGRRRTQRQRLDYEHLLEVLGLKGLVQRMPASLSGGEKQRVALGRAILREPDFLLLDEPLSALDEELKREISRYLENVVAEYHLPMLLVSHDQGSVSRLADAVIEVRQGRVEERGQRSEVGGRNG